MHWTQGTNSTITRRAIVIFTIGLGAAACSSGNVNVRTESAPGVLLADRHTFRLLPTPAPAGNLALETNDPMLNNSLTNRALRDDIRNALISRGFQPAGGGRADMDVAYYAAANQALDLHTYDYGYTWRGWPREYTDVTTYERGTVIIDLVDPGTHQLLWRGTGVSPVSTNPNKYVGQLGTTVSAIIKKMP